MSQLPVKIGAREYVVDMSLQELREESIPSQTDQQFVSTPELGERSLNQRGVWRRGWDSWHHGAGQDEADLTDSLRTRYRASKGINPWQKGKLTLLNRTERILDTSGAAPDPSNSGTFTTATGDGVWVNHHNTVEHSANALTATPTWNTVTGLNAGVVYGVHYDHSTFKCYIAQGAAGVYATAGSSGTDAYTASSIGTPPSDIIIGVTTARQRIIGWSTSKLYDLTADATGLTFVTFPPGAQIEAVADGQTAILVGANDDRGGVIFRVPIAENGTALDVATIIGRLPDGETLSTIHAYLGYLLIGVWSTEGSGKGYGMRLAQVDTNSITFGPTVGGVEGQVNTPVDFHTVGRFVYAGHASGITCFDLTTFVDSLAPAWASDIEAVEGGLVSGIGGRSRKLFYTSGQGLYREATAKLDSGWLETGIFRYGLTEPKIIHDAKVFLSAGAATVALRSAPGIGGFGVAVGAPDYVLGNLSLAGPELRVNLGVNAVVDGFVVRATPVAENGEYIILPIILSEAVTYDGDTRAYDSVTEIEYLRGLRRTQQAVTLYRGGLTDTVTVDDYVWRPEREYTLFGSEAARWAGVIFVKCKTI